MRGNDSSKLLAPFRLIGDMFDCIRTASKVDFSKKPTFELKGGSIQRRRLESVAPQNKQVYQ